MKKILLAALSTLIFVPQISQAHGSATTLSQTTGSYILEFEYSSENNIKTGELALLDVYLLDLNQNPQDFESVFIKILDSNAAIIFYGTFKETSDVKGAARMGTIIKEPGDYQVQVQFNKSGQVLSASYNITVDPGASSKQGTVGLTQDKSTIILEIILVASGLILGIAVGPFIRRKIKS